MKNFAMILLIGCLACSVYAGKPLRASFNPPHPDNVLTVQEAKQTAEQTPDNVAAREEMQKVVMSTDTLNLDPLEGDDDNVLETKLNRKCAVMGYKGECFGDSADGKCEWDSEKAACVPCATHLADPTNPKARCIRKFGDPTADLMTDDGELSDEAKKKFHSDGETLAWWSDSRKERGIEYSDDGAHGQWMHGDHIGEEDFDPTELRRRLSKKGDRKLQGKRRLSQKKGGRKLQNGTGGRGNKKGNKGRR